MWQCLLFCVVAFSKCLNLEYWHINIKCVRKQIQRGSLRKALMCIFNTICTFTGRSVI
jgi:hypothetical protein